MTIGERIKAKRKEKNISVEYVEMCIRDRSGTFQNLYFRYAGAG